MEKKVIVLLCAKITADTDLYEMDKEVQNPIDWVCLLEQIKDSASITLNENFLFVDSYYSEQV
ncbi:MAG: hypothetical protein HFH33_06805 [Eubacterium sp.]|jgi:hypothetical protein|nr:hypothetical protein [Eubacterium sp.]